MLVCCAVLAAHGTVASGQSRAREVASVGGAVTETGYDLWLRYRRITNAPVLADYRSRLQILVMPAPNATLRVARDELTRGLRGLLGAQVRISRDRVQRGALVVGTPASSSVIAALHLDDELKPLGDEGFLIRSVT